MKKLSAIGSSSELYGPECELRKSKESFTCTDQIFDMNDSISTISVSGSHQNSPVHNCADMSVRRQQNRSIECVGRSLCRSDDSCAEELGFSNVPLEQHLSVYPITESCLGISDDSCAEELLGFSDVPLEQHLSVYPITESCLGISDDSSAEELLGFLNVQLEQHLYVYPITESCLGISDESSEEGLLGFSDVLLEQHLSVYPITESCLGISDDSSAEELLGFSDVPLEQHLSVYPITESFLDISDLSVEQGLNKDSITDVVPPDLHVLSDGSNKCAESNGVTEGFNSAANFLSSESRNMSIVLFDSWDSGNGTKLQTTLERPHENKEAVVFDESQVSISRVGYNNSENSRTDVSKHHHLHESLLDGDESDCKYPRDKSELLRSSISKEHLFQEPSDTIIGTGEPHTDDVISLLSQPYFTVDGNPFRFKMRGLQVPRD
jgi:hypothetical protein